MIIPQDLVTDWSQLWVQNGHRISPQFFKEHLERKVLLKTLISLPNKEHKQKKSVSAVSKLSRQS